MRFVRRFQVEAPLAAVVSFHQRVEGFRALAPPGVPLRLHRVADPMVHDAELDFTLWLGPLPVRWVARIEELEGGEGFRDRQLRGPFRSWVHTHRFRALGDSSTEITDEIEASLRRHLLWGPVGLAMWLGLPLLFAYRARRTRRILAAAR